MSNEQITNQELKIIIFRDLVSMGKSKSSGEVPQQTQGIGKKLVSKIKDNQGTAINQKDLQNHKKINKKISHKQKRGQKINRNIQFQAEFKLLKPIPNQETLIRNFPNSRLGRRFYLPQIQLKSQKSLFIQQFDNKNVSSNDYLTPKVSQRISDEEYFPNPPTKKKHCGVCQNNQIRQLSYKEHVQSQDHKKNWQNSKKQSNLAQVLSFDKNQNRISLDKQSRQKNKDIRKRIKKEKKNKNKNKNKRKNKKKNKQKKQGVPQKRVRINNK